MLMSYKVTFIARPQHIPIRDSSYIFSKGKDAFEGSIPNAAKSNAQTFLEFYFSFCMDVTSCSLCKICQSGEVLGSR